MINRLYDRLQVTWLWLILLSVFNVTDLLSTYMMLSDTRQESSALWNTLDLHSPLAICLKLAFPFLVIALGLVVSKRIFSLVVRGLTFMFLLVTIGNLCGGIPVTATWQIPLVPLGYAYTGLLLALLWTIAAKRLESRRLPP